MNLSSDHNEKDYERLIEALTPRHAPVTDMKFTPPTGLLKSRVARLLNHVGRVAAVLAIGVGIGLLISRSDTTVAADKVVQLGIEKMRSSRMCQIDFKARMLPSTPIRPFRLSPDGEMTSVRMVFRPDSTDASITFRWSMDGQDQSITVMPDGDVHFCGRRLGQAVPLEFLRHLMRLFYSDRDTFENILKCDFAVADIGAAINVNGHVRGNTIGIAATFSDKNRGLERFRIYDTSGSPMVLMVETDSIKYYD